MTDPASGQGGGLSSRFDDMGGDEWIGSTPLDTGSSISKDGHWEEGKSAECCFDETS